MKKLSIIIIVVLFSTFTFAQEHKENPEKTAKTGNVIFRSLIYDFGIIKYGQDVQGEFIFKNISKTPVKIGNVKPACGCTGTEWPRDEIKKNKTGIIKVSYDTKRVGKFDKAIFVFFEGQNEPIQLRIKGEVLPEEKSNQEIEKKQTEESKSKKFNSDPSKKHKKAEIKENHSEKNQ
ncbi:MAG: DUF1573 domain-containing protein [Bacteroidales bacterium]|jgi:hypothetical protein|nr:DUF1573 domain-containing protein [Bacteroidales bacterium]HOL96926.1 DUF1573 domain-containing protein [Bacteroidales bacterium]HOM36768.1 DUF1573 domain-containing protein [Bacteroidales bacterium]HPD24242.1 DUF1573 domain-containing protein [Bacteroidales bacterium]HRS98483.1 DUF1573 domain-containing protein [Bacteroidales bacterium]